MLICDQVANKKQRDTAAADAEMKARREAQAQTQEDDISREAESGTTDILAADDDDDIIF